MNKKNILSVINNTIINIYGTTPIMIAGKTIARIKCSSAGKYIYVNYINVDNEYRGNGIATAIVNRMIIIHNDKQIGALCYDTSFGLFERCGFINYGVPVTRIDGKYYFYGTRSMIYNP